MKNHTITHMYLTIKIPLDINEKQINELKCYEEVFKLEVLKVISYFEKHHHIVKYPYVKINSQIAYYSKRNVLHIASNLYRYKSKGHKAIYRKSSTWSNLSFHIDKDMLILDYGEYFFVPHGYYHMKLRDHLKKRLKQGKPIRLDIVFNGKYWFANVTLDIEEQSIISTKKKMAVDLGIKVPAVVYTENGKIRFFGNGRKIRYLNRRYFSQYGEYQRVNNLRAIRLMNHKLLNMKRELDHKIAKEIIEFARKEEIGIIRLESLQGIQKRMQDKGYRQKGFWSYDRLQRYIMYKAELAGINVEFVDPKNTSKICPNCGMLNQAKDRMYICSCGFKKHRDIVGAMNILNAPLI